MDIQKKIAFILPTYPPHYDRTKHFVKSFKKNGLSKQADIWFVFSSEDDKNSFPQLTEKYVIMPKELQDLGRDEGVINAKKFYGINAIKSQYEYIIVVDSDMEIFKDVDLYSICKSIFSNRILWGTPLPYDSREIYDCISKSCMTFFPDIEINIQGLGYWFMNLCVYDVSTLDDFFEKTKLLKNLSNLNFWSFDYYIYMFYLLAYQEFKPQNVFCSSFEEAKADLINKTYTEKFMFMCTKEMLSQLEKLSSCKNCFIHLHLDRANTLSPRKRKCNLLRRILSLFMPTRELRRKVRGDVK